MTDVATELLLINPEPIALDFKFKDIRVVNPEITQSHKGMPFKLSDKVVRAVVLNLAAGSTITVAARAAGVARKTFYQWMDIGHDIFDNIENGQVVEALPPHEHLCLYLFEMVQMAEAGAEIQLLQLVLKEGGPGAKWMLQRRWPERWAHKQIQQVQHTGEIKLDWGQPSDVPIAEEEVVDGEFTELQDEEIVLLTDGQTDWEQIAAELE